MNPNCSYRKSTQTRRDFFKTISAAAVSALIMVGSGCDPGKGDDSTDDLKPEPKSYPPRAGLGNVFVTSDGKPILVSVSGTEFPHMLSAGLEALGGLGLLLSSGTDVLVKPNLVEKSHYPWISSTESIVSIIEAVRNVTDGNINVGDEAYDITAEVYDHLDFDNAVRNAGGTPVYFSGSRIVRRESWDSGKPSFKVYSDVYSAPVIINTCVLKRHFLADMTCALKNNVGTITAAEATGTRDYLHYRADSLHHEVAEVAGLVNPELNIVDARSIVTGIGPFKDQGGGAKQANRIILSGDIVATDVYCAHLMEKFDVTFSKSKIQGTLRRAADLGLGTSDLNHVEVIEISL
jgi:uncharacterized protein (DUF362 family)